jgi:hypothetical protein
MVKASRDQFGENILAVRILTLWWKLVVDHFGENIRAVRILTKECELHFYFSKSEITMVKASRPIWWEYSRGENSHHGES